MATVLRSTSRLWDSKVSVACIAGVIWRAYLGVAAIPEEWVWYIEKLKKLKLLFVEDEEDLIEIISDTLVKLNANFLTATNGEEALALIEKNNDIFFGFKIFPRPFLAKKNFFSGQAKNFFGNFLI